MSLAIGAKLGPYEILSRLGEGGMGEVYRAKDSRLQREVAIKVLPDRFAQDADALARFRRESMAVAALSHPNIRAIYDIGTHEGRAFAVMELLEGDTLADRLERSALDWQEAVRIALAIADGLAAAHSKGIIHRDVKPKNIFLTADGGVKLLDFGLARFGLRGSDEDEEATWVDTATLTTLPGTIVGTASFMSPEQVRGKPVDERSDVFSFGCVVYEMLAGKQAFSRETAIETMAAVLNEPPATLSEVKTDIPRELEQIVVRCLEKNPSRRFQSVDDLSLALKGVQQRMDSGEGSTWQSGTPAPGFTPTPHRAGEATEPSVAVLPFVNMSSDRENEYFGDGLAEELINALCKIESLHVASRTSSFAFKGRSEDVRRIAEILNVRTILEGSVRKAGTTLRISSQLINADDGYHLWSETFDREMEDVFAIQDEIAQAIARTLEVVLSEGEKGVLASVPTENIEAYECYLRGRQFFHQFRRTALEHALELFGQAC
ncbi:MAG: protein kinase, partial [Phycisphaerales bacterium]